MGLEMGPAPERSRLGSNERGRSVFAAKVEVVGRYRLDY